ncbi:MAG: helix-turn-helix domain-containing protein [Streptosporangiaceae bacterium]
MSDEAGNPAVHRRRLRAALRQARQAASLTQEQVAEALDWSLSKVVRIESGSVRISTTDLRALLYQYKVTDARRVGELVAMAKASRQHPWWAAYREFASQRYLEFVEFEHAARATLHFQPLFVPGTLQTRDYASAIILRLARDVTDARANGLLEFRMRRQKLLEESEPPMLSFVLDESVLHRHVGTDEIMRGQFDRLIELSARPNISIRMFPFASGLTYGMQQSFVIHQFPDPEDLDVLYLEGPRGDTIVASDEDEVGRYLAAFEELRRMSLSEPESATFIKKLRSNLQ